MNRPSVLWQLGIETTGTPSFRKMFPLDHEHAKEAKDTHMADGTESMIITNTEDRLVVFTDGACSHNGSKHAKAGYAVVWPYHRSWDTSKRLVGIEQTNNRAEYSALIEAQNIADQLDPLQQKPLYVYTDSELLINSITKWMPNWKKNNWKKADKKPVLNQDLLKNIDANPRPLIFKHVRAHTGRKDWESTYNHEADRLAREALSL